jgi:hydrogenase expression/formation protein HypE
MSNPSGFQGLVCPMPITRRDQVVMAHGSGGRMTHDLIKRLFLPP